MWRSPLMRSVLSGPGGLAVCVRTQAVCAMKSAATATTSCRRVMPRTIAPRLRRLSGSAGIVLGVDEPPSPFPPRQHGPPCPPKPWRRRSCGGAPPLLLRRPPVCRLHDGDVRRLLAELFLTAGRATLVASPRPRHRDVAVARAAHRAGVADALRQPGAAPASRAALLRARAGHRGGHAPLRALHAAGGAAATWRVQSLLPRPRGDDARGV